MTAPLQGLATDAAPAVLADVARTVDDRLDRLFDEQRLRWLALDDHLVDAFDSLHRFVTAGGKRVRPAFCVLGHRAAGVSSDPAAVVDAAAALELLHTFALIHDDVMDGSSRRRNQPTVHVEWQHRHGVNGWSGEERRFGEGMAILLGDLAFVLADLLLGEVPGPARRIYDELRLELHVGQYLDLLGAAQRSTSMERARTVAVFKSGKYTVERPLHLGAAMAGRLDELAGPFTRFGLPLGEAFQLRDDLLGAFGDEAVVGKPVGDDFREGKSTPLVAMAAERARVSGDRAALAVLDRLGDPGLDADDVDDLRAVIEALGARSAVERRVERLVSEACVALDEVDLPADTRRSLTDLAAYTATRAI